MISWDKIEVTYLEISRILKTLGIDVVDTTRFPLVLRKDGHDVYASCQASNTFMDAWSSPRSLAYWICMRCDKFRVYDPYNDILLESIANPLLGCRSLEEMEIKADLLEN